MKNERNLITKKICNIFFLIFILSFSYHQPIIYKFPLIKISEIIFIFFFLFFFIIIINNKIRLSLDKFDMIFLLYPLTFIPNFFINNFSLNSFLGVCSGVYLFSIYYLTKNLIFHFNLTKEYFLRKFVILGVVLTIISIISIFLKINNYDVSTVANIGKYPFSFDLGFRVMGFMGSASMMAIIEIITILSSLSLYFSTKKKKYIIISIIFIISLYFTFAKSVLLFVSVITILLLFNYKLNKSQKIFYFFSLFIFFTHLFITNFLIVGNESQYLKNEYFTVKDAKPIFKNEKIEIIPSYYFFQKAKNIEIIKKNYLTGVGSFEFKNYKYKNYDYLNKFNPHSVFLGAISENGLLNLCAIILIFLKTFKISYKNENKSFFLILLYLFLESFNADIITFKILWITFAVIISKDRLYTNEKN